MKCVSKTIPIARRLNMAKAMLITKILHSAAGWGLMDAREMKKNHSNVMWILRRVWAAEVPVHELNMTDAQILAELKMMSPLNLVRRARIKLGFRMLSSEAAWVLSILAADQSPKAWRAAVFADLKFLVAACEGFMFAEQYTMAQWARHARSEGNRFLKDVDAVLESELANESHGTVFGYDGESLGRGADIGVLFPCNDCAYIAKSHHSLVLHQIRDHNLVVPLQLRVPGAICPICITNFWTRSRCLNHAVQSKYCNSKILALPTCLTTDEVVGLRAIDETGKKHHRAGGRQSLYAERQCIDAPGPVAYEFKSLVRKRFAPIPAIACEGTTCPASFSVRCTPSCLICRGSQQISVF